MSTRTTKYRAGAIGITLACAAAAAIAAEPAADSGGKPRAASRQENIGVFTGIAVGAVAGGPFGAILGGAAGGWLGNRYHNQLVAKQTLSTELSATRAELAHDRSEQSERTQRLAALNGSLQATQADRERLATALEPAKQVSTQVSFRTDDAAVSEESAARLEQFAAVARALPDVKVHVEGYADPRGAEGYNVALSQRRAGSVAQVLVDAGLDEDRLVIEGHGAREAHCAEGDLDGYALERRVTVRLESAASGEVAQVQ